MTNTKPWRDDLITGYRDFRKGRYLEDKALYEELGTHGQTPQVMMISCCDSRADPSDIFHAYPGELFVLRNVANLVPPVDPSGGYHGTSAAIEYAIAKLQVKAIVVMGHESCGGIQGSLMGMGTDGKSGYVGKWVSLLNGVRDRVVGDTKDPQTCQHKMEYEGVRQSLKNLMTFDFVAEAVNEGTLDLMGAYFSIIQGKLQFMNADGIFEDVAAQ